MKYILLLLINFIIFNIIKSTYISPLDNINIQNTKINIDDDVNIIASPDILLHSRDEITIKYSNIKNPKLTDYIASYVSSTLYNSPNSSAPLSFQKLSDLYPDLTDDDEIPTSGEMKWNIINIRDDIAFGYFQGTQKEPILISTSNSITFNNLNEPSGIKLALTNNINELRISWITKYAKQPVIYYKLETDDEWTYKLNAETLTFTSNDVCGSPASTTGWHDPGLMHSVIISDLKLNTKYIYKVGDDGYDNGNYSPEYEFLTQSDIGTTVRIATFGDMGTAEPDNPKVRQGGENSQYPAVKTTNFIQQELLSTEKSLFNMPLSLVLHIGDISYARGYLHVWDTFHSQILPVSTQIPWMTSDGNHERDYSQTSSYHPNPSLYQGTDSGGECGVPYQNYFRMPEPADEPMGDQTWYSFNYGPIHFTIMSTEHNFTKNSEQWEWIKNDLENVDRDITPWVVFGGHRPMYIDSTYYEILDPSSSKDQNTAHLLRVFIEPLLFDNQVDVALWGHHHSYQRTCSLYQGKCIASSNQPYNKDSYNGPAHMVIGMAGKSLSQNILPKTPDYYEFIDVEEWGMVTMEANSTLLHMSFYESKNYNLKDELYRYHD